MLHSLTNSICWTYMWDKVQEGISTERTYCKSNQETE